MAFLEHQINKYLRFKVTLLFRSCHGYFAFSHNATLQSDALTFVHLDLE